MTSLPWKNRPDINRTRSVGGQTAGDGGGGGGEAKWPPRKALSCRRRKGKNAPVSFYARRCTHIPGSYGNFRLIAQRTRRLKVRNISTYTRHTYNRILGLDIEREASPIRHLTNKKNDSKRYLQTNETNRYDIYRQKKRIDTMSKSKKNESIRYLKTRKNESVRYRLKKKTIVVNTSSIFDTSKLSFGVSAKKKHGDARRDGGQSTFDTTGCPKLLSDTSVATAQQALGQLFPDRR